MSHPRQPPGYHHLGGNVFVATADAPLPRIRPAPLQPAPPGSPPPRPAEAVVQSYCDARATAVTPRADSRGLAQANMRRQLAADGIKPAA